MYRVGIVGCGGISGVHAKVLSGMEDVSLIACADILPQRAQALADQFGCRAYDSFTEMLDSEPLDAVHICTPHYMHPMMAGVAARRGIAVFTEKPPAIDLAGWEEIKAAARLVPLGVCFQNRYNGSVLACEGLLRENTYGPLLGIRAFVTWSRGENYYAPGGWKGGWATEGGGALINQAIHTLDLIIRLMGRPDQVASTIANHHLQGHIQVEDTAEIWMKRGNTTAHLYASTAYITDAPVLLELQFQDAVLRLEDDRLELRRQGETTRLPCPADEKMGLSYWGAGHKRCIEDFYRCLPHPEMHKNNAASCEDTMQVLLKVYEQNAKAL